MKKGMNEQAERFVEINTHLQNDPCPSLYFNQIYDEAWFQEYPFDGLYKLKVTEQSPKYHPEGNVWIHTMLVIDEAANIKKRSKSPEVFMWAALLHDIGKAPATRVHKGKITAYDHDKIGAKLAKDFLSCLTEDEAFIKDVAKLVRWHLQILFVVNSLQFSDIITMSKQVDIEEIALLGLCDRIGRKNADRASEEKNIELFLKRCRDKVS